MRLSQLLMPAIVGAMLFCSYQDDSLVKRFNYVIKRDSVELIKKSQGINQDSFPVDTLIAKKPNGKLLKYIDFYGDRDLDKFRIFDGGVWTDYSDEAPTMYWAQVDYLNYLAEINKIEGRLK